MESEEVFYFFFISTIFNRQNTLVRFFVDYKIKKNYRITWCNKINILSLRIVLEVSAL